MKRIWQYIAAAIIIGISLLANGINAIGQEHMFVNPGIKLGYVFGDAGGFIFGIEVSVTKLNEDNGVVIGGVFDWDIVTATGRQKLHLGVEGGWAFFGIDIGPTWVSEPSGERLFGITTTPYGGVGLAYFYYSTTIISGENINELGLYLKAPLHTDKRAIFD